MTTAAIDLDWTTINRFSPGEWPPGVLEKMNGNVILALADIRDSLPRDHRMTPSPVPGTSRHSLEGGRLSDATDIYMDAWPHAYAAWEKALHHPAIGGLGFYLDKWIGNPNNNRPMLHFDCRDEKIYWVCYRAPNGNDVYVYHHRDPERFHQLMSRRQ